MASQLSYEVEVTNLHLGDAFNEKSESFRDAKMIQFGCRDANDGPASFRWSHVPGGTIAGPYISAFSGIIVFETDVRMSQRIYFSSSVVDAVIEVIIWR